MGHKNAEIEARGASVVAIAVTATFSQMAFAEHLQVPFPLLSDWGGRTADAYGARYDVWKGHEGVAKRSLFVVDRAGLVRYRWLTDDALVMPDLGEPLQVLAGLT